jgi:L-arabinose isomerase
MVVESKQSTPRVAMLVPFTRFWQTAVAYDLADELGRFAGAAVAGLGGDVDIASIAMIGDREEGKAARLGIECEDVDAVLVFQAMAVMPAYVLAALPQGVPIIVWSVTRHVRLADPYDHAAIVTGGSTVGTPMLTSVLTRHGRPFELVIGRPEDAATRTAVIASLRAACAARSVQRGRLGLVGSEIDGYDCVTLDARRVNECLGLTVVSIEPAEVAELWRTVSPQRVAELEREVREAFDVDADIEGDVLARTIRAACAIEDLVERHKLDAGAMNCHVPEIRLGSEIGIAPCFGLGQMTTRGIPWTCSGDGLTAIAMLMLKSLGAAAQYHELEAFDLASGEFVIANTGEHDLAFGDGEMPQLTRNRWFAKDPLCGACACFTGKPGPATLVGFVQLDAPRPKYRLVVASGELTRRRFPDVGTPNGAFRFGAAGEAVAAWSRWCRAGVNHHSAAAPGDHAAALAAVARLLGIEAEFV